MNRQHDRAVCVMSIGGGRYFEQYKIIEKQMREYAGRCKADFVFIDEWIDKERQRDVYSQKLLIADYLSEYELVLFLDLDVIISPDCPDIFEDIPDDCGLAAVLNPRGTDKFQKIYAGNKRILSETVEDYFECRGFDVNDAVKPRLIGNINGGVLVFRPRLVAQAFKDYYYSQHMQGSNTAYEEAPMAYYTQTNGIFYALDERFNKMLHFESGRPGFAHIYNVHHNRIYLLADKIFKKIFHKNNVFLTRLHTQFVKALIDEGAYMVHMSGGFYSTQAAKRLMKTLYGASAK